MPEKTRDIKVDVYTRAVAVVRINPEALFDGEELEIKLEKEQLQTVLNCGSLSIRVVKQ